MNCPSCHCEFAFRTDGNAFVLLFVQCGVLFVCQPMSASHALSAQPTSLSLLSRNLPLHPNRACRCPCLHHQPLPAHCLVQPQFPPRIATTQPERREQPGQPPRVLLTVLTAAPSLRPRFASAGGRHSSNKTSKRMTAATNSPTPHVSRWRP